ncbi:hypothetical protein CDAR_230751 [Caerostris darwini]|uniref:Uncharacterized protein n=1 Tax=Caerostris darwini TaxID=1538125 RepID=A0AAV4S6W4_9ARAC|nr:hypothetical protein CDAR_230751 [Caerostris darwini]
MGPVEDNARAMLLRSVERKTNYRTGWGGVVHRFTSSAKTVRCCCSSVYGIHPPPRCLECVSHLSLFGDVPSRVVLGRVAKYACVADWEVRVAIQLGSRPAMIRHSALGCKFASKHACVQKR